MVSRVAHTLQAKTHLFSDAIILSANTTYVLISFVHVISRASSFIVVPAYLVQELWPSLHQCKNVLIVT